MYLLWCNEDRADNDDILWLIKNERNYEASEWLKNLIRDGFDSLIENPAIGIKQKTVERRWKELFEGELAKTKDALESLNLTWAYTDVYEYSGKYSNQVAWERFTEYMVFYDEVVDYNNELAPAPALYDVYYAYDPATEEEAALCVDDVIQIAEENGAEIQIW